MCSVRSAGYILRDSDTHSVWLIDIINSLDVFSMFHRLHSEWDSDTHTVWLNDIINSLGCIWYIPDITMQREGRTLDLVITEFDHLLCKLLIGPKLVQSPIETIFNQRFIPQNWANLPCR